LTESLLLVAIKWVITFRVQAAMSSALEIVLWGAPVVLLSWGLLLGLGCAVLFRDEHSSREEPRTSGMGAGL
jgi:hypothetical protein